MLKTQQQIPKEEIEVIKEWTNFGNYSMLFDSDIDGNGNGTLNKLLMNKKNLVFIHFDGDNNVFGGFLPRSIDKLNSYLSTPYAFLFSLFRNKEIINTKYKVKNGMLSNAFMMHSSTRDRLYSFGIDLIVFQVGCRQSFSKPMCYFDYATQTNCLVQNHPYVFDMKRIIVLQMY
ncbi:TLDc domain-containing protein [Entamoeba marina]